MSRDGALYCVGCSEVDIQPSQKVEVSTNDEKPTPSKTPSDDPGASPSPRKIAATSAKSEPSTNAYANSGNLLELLSKHRVMIMIF